MITKKTGRVSAVVLGLIAGIILFIIAVIAATVLIFGSSMLGLFDFMYYAGLAGVLAGIVIFVIGLLNMIGGCIVRRSRIAGGILMIITAIPIILASFIFVRLGGPWSFILVLGLMSLTAAILAFVPYTSRYIQLYAQRKGLQYPPQQPYQQYQPQQPYQQPQQYQQPPQQQYQQPAPPQQQYQQPPAAPQQAAPTPPEDNKAK